MYKHLLVPLDDTPLSSANVVTSLELARSWGARITFFHATADFAATSDGALLYSMDPPAFVQEAPGTTNAVLAKAIAAAHSAQVACSATARTSDRPAEAIVEVAQEHGCDLIVMACQGLPANRWRGWLHNSRTERVLRHAPIALLVTRVAAEQPMNDRERAVGIIVDEHQSIAAVAGAMRDIAGDLVQGAGSESDLRALAGMLSYMRQFPERVHHPKEENCLHRRMRARNASCDALLNEVEAQHEVERHLIETVAARLDHVAGQDGLPALHEAVLGFVAHVFAHLKLEESKVLPLAQECLLEADWSAIAQAFSSNDAGGFGELSSSQFRRMFTQIANGIADREAQT